MSITLPVVVTGSDPTRVPIAAMVGPAAGSAVIALACVMAGVFARPPRPDQAPVPPADRL